MVVQPTSTFKWLWSKFYASGLIGWKVMTPVTKLLVKDFNSMDLDGTDAQERFDALGIAMTFADSVKSSRTKTRKFLETIKLDTVEGNVEWLEKFGQIGNSRYSYLFWTDFYQTGHHEMVKLDDMGLDMKSMWMFSTLATLPRGKLSFDEMAAYLLGNGDVDKLVAELFDYSKYLAAMDDGGKEKKDWTEVLVQSEMHSNRDGVLRTFEENAFYVLYKEIGDKRLLALCAYTYLFPAAIDNFGKNKIPTWHKLTEALKSRSKEDVEFIKKCIDTSTGK
eukprot:GHVS01078419.1.p1 GENE.GHVS01078419.1~~GHVS01078419.1.p1  ORF type:complete len:324 (+),score=29.94 GHVS01078419.1:139-972(+)